MKPAIEFQALRDKAIAGDFEAASLLFLTAFDAVDCLKQVALNNPKVLLPITEKTPAFPALIVPNKSRDEEHARILRDCSVGKQSTWNTASTAAMKFDTPAKRAAQNFYRFIQDVRDGAKIPDEQSVIDACKALPKPTREAFKEWDKVLRMLLPPIEAFPDEWKTVAPLDLTPGQRLDAIKKAVSQAFYTLLPD